MKPVSVVLSVISVVCLSAAATPAAPAPAAPDCSTLVISMVDCLSFVSNNSTVKKPQGSCCTGLKTVMKSNPECLCEAFKNSAQLGVSLNVTKALTLPHACHVASPPLHNCDGVSNGSPAPAMAPRAAMSPIAATGVPSTAAGTTKVAPAPAPKSSASGFTTSVGSVLALAVALISWI